MWKFIAGLVIVVVLGFWAWHVEYGTERTVTFKIASKDDQSSGSSHKYLIFTSGNHVYEDTDSILHGKQDSSNVWAMLHVGNTYTCPVYGFRIFFMSSYQDILDGCRLDKPGTATNTAITSVPRTRLALAS